MWPSRRDDRLRLYEHASMLYCMRLRHGLTQLELAKHAGVSRQTISSLERGRSTPSLALARVLAARLDLPVEDLFDGAELR
ncbi:MAG TPA: helix-turn-helix transcriptional regulator [Gaiellaceae bacterium]|nr:helix-turn-helix transcriptional regulator [Gaiellaceae bacterium]